MRDTNLCRIRVVSRPDRLLVFAAIDNLWKGAAGQAIQNLNLMLGLRRDGGPRSELVLPLALGRRPRRASRSSIPTRLAPGFVAAGVPCGLKDGGGTDLGLVARRDGEVASALLLTRNAAAAAPIRVCRDSCRRRGGRAR